MKKRFVLLALVAASASVTSAFAAQVCVSYYSDGSCAGWVDTGNGGYTSSSNPGAPDSPTRPQCVCAGYNTQGSFTYYVGC